MDLGYKFYNSWLPNTFRLILNNKSASDLWFEKYDNPEKYSEELEVSDLEPYFNEIKNYFISLGGVANINYWSKYDFSKEEHIIKICDEKEINKLKDFLWSIKAHLK